MVCRGRLVCLSDLLRFATLDAMVFVLRGLFFVFDYLFHGSLSSGDSLYLICLTAVVYLCYVFLLALVSIAGSQDSLDVGWSKHGGKSCRGFDICLFSQDALLGTCRLLFNLVRSSVATFGSGLPITGLT